MSGSTQLQRRGARVAVERTEASQRQRLIAAMAQVAAEHGRRAASVDLVCERAGMSRRTFYEHFTDGEQCFVSAVGQAFDQLFAAINAAVGTEAQDWEDRACTTVAALIATLDRDRTLARLCVVEPHSGSAVALSIRHAAVHRLALVLAAGATVGDVALRDAAARGAVGAILELATDPILADEPLQSIVAPALYTALAPFTGRRIASRRAADPPRIASVSVVGAADVPLGSVDRPAAGHRAHSADRPASRWASRGLQRRHRPRGRGAPREPDEPSSRPSRARRRRAAPQGGPDQRLAVDRPWRGGSAVAARGAVRRIAVELRRVVFGQ